MEADWFGWREGVFLLIGLTFVYLVMTLLRLIQVGRTPAKPADLAHQEPAEPQASFLPLEETIPARENPPAEQHVERHTERSIERNIERNIERHIERTNEPDDYITALAASEPEPTIAAPATQTLDLELHGHRPVPVADATGVSTVVGFGEQLAEHLARAEAENEIRRIKVELEALRGEHGRLCQEVAQLRAEVEELRAVRNVSPHYAEAAELSQRGLDARDIAARMGISLAEAELVHALSRGENLFDVGDLQHGGNR